VSEWSECSGAGECSPGDVGDGECGNCGKRTRTCSEACVWGQYGPCTGEGPCSPGQTEKAECGNCGTHERLCGESCAFGDWGPCEGEGICVEGDTTPCPGCGFKACTGACQWGDCSLPVLDSYEPNNSSGQAWSLPDLPDDCDDSGFTLAGNLRPEGDADWYGFHVHDSLLCGLDPTLIFKVGDGSDSYQVCIYYYCDSGGIAQSCQSVQGPWADKTVAVDVAACGSGPGIKDQSGKLYIFIKAASGGDCAEYTLAFHP
jgi:hypothetical protein